MQAVCKSDVIELNMFGLTDLNKEDVAIIVILCDIGICLSFFIACIILKMF